MTYFHVTAAANLLSIRQHGLLPTVGNRSFRAKEGEVAVFLFPTPVDCENALMNWLGDEFEDTDLIVLEVEETGLPLDFQVPWEVKSFDKIGPERILAVLSEEEFSEKWCSLAPAASPKL